MKQDYSLQTGEVEYYNQITSSGASPIFAREILSKSSALPSFGKNYAGNKILKNLAPKVLRSLSPMLERVSLEKGQAICEAGDITSSVYFPETAVISEFQILPDGKTTGLTIIGNEGLHGISVLLGEPTANNWAQALAAGTALKISINALRQYFDYCKSARQSILKYLNYYLAQISQTAVCNNHHSVSERLCSWILMLDDRCQNYPLSLTQEQIAWFLGAQRPSITIITQSLRKRAMIDYQRGKFFILNRRQLESTACGCYKAMQAASM